MTRGRCEIVCVKSRHPLRWRWRRTDSDGSVQSSVEEFDLFYDCVSAARGAGYDPFFAGRRIICASN
jgi:hypothetical protein